MGGGMRTVVGRHANGHPAVFYGVPEGTAVEPIVLHAYDGKQTRGLYWTSKHNPRPRTAVVAMHPRQDWSRHYTFPRLIQAGIGCLGAVTRSPNNDIASIHEELILDAEACVRFLKEERGVEQVVLLGNGGGGSLLAFYQAQARLPRGNRLTHTPGGRTTMLNDFDMVAADGIIFLLCHKGEGRFMNEVIDPAVIDELNPLQTYPALDMYDSKNGFREAPEWSRYTDDFLRQHAAAQSERVSRIDQRARAMIDESQDAEALLADPDFRKLPEERRRRLQRRADWEPVITIYRTMARPAYVDDRIDPSRRPYGSLLSERPDLMNMKFQGFGRLATPQAWLSTWSGHTSNADLEKNVANLTEPALVLHAGKSPEIYRQSDCLTVFEALGSIDKQFHEFPDADHYFRSEPGAGNGQSAEDLMNVVVSWIGTRFTE